MTDDINQPSIAPEWAFIMEHFGRNFVIWQFLTMQWNMKMTTKLVSSVESALVFKMFFDKSMN